jgi:hypothetical protein
MWLTCPDCRDESPFEQPPCTDEHDGDCPEWFCVSCGYAVFAGEQVAIVALVNEPRSHESSSKSKHRSGQSHAA